MEDQALKLLTPSGFDAAYFSNLANSKTQKEAYEKTEAIYKKHFKKCRYSGFDSYRVVRNARIFQKR